ADAAVRDEAQDAAADTVALPAGVVSEAARPVHGRVAGAGGGTPVAHFYIDWRLEAASVGGRVTVGGTEARHAVTVGRLRVGESIRVGNGKGLVVTGTVAATLPAQFSIEVTDVATTPLPE